MAIKRWTDVKSWDELPQVIGMSELCMVLRITRPTALKYLRERKIAAVKMDKDWRIDKDAVREFLKGGNVA